jgi:hypothetical protein
VRIGANARVQAWIEASTKGAVLLFVSSEAEYDRTRADVFPGVPELITSSGTTLALSALETSLPEFPEVSSEVSRRPMPPWVSAPA